MRLEKAPNLVKYLGVHIPPEAPDERWLLLEYAKFGSLSDIFVSARVPRGHPHEALWEERRRGLLAADGALLSVVAGAARGLANLHRIGLVHRDVALRNMLWGADGSVLICDFGLVRPVSGASGSYCSRMTQDLP